MQELVSDLHVTSLKERTGVGVQLTAALGWQREERGFPGTSWPFQNGSKDPWVPGSDGEPDKGSQAGPP
jgi:hypothetical protein